MDCAGYMRSRMTALSGNRYRDNSTPPCGWKVSIQMTMASTPNPMPHIVAKNGRKLMACDAVRDKVNCDCADDSRKRENDTSRNPCRKDASVWADLNVATDKKE